MHHLTHARLRKVPGQGVAHRSHQRKTSRSAVRCRPQAPLPGSSGELVLRPRELGHTGWAPRASADQTAPPGHTSTHVELSALPCPPPGPGSLASVMAL